MIIYPLFYFMKMKKQVFTICIITNFLISTAIYAQTTRTTNSVTISNCTLGCIGIIPPDDLVINQPIFINPDGQKILFSFDPNYDQNVKIFDIRNGGNAWDLSISVSDLNSTTTTDLIPYTQLGVLTYTNNSFLYPTDTLSPPPTRVNAPLNKNITFDDFQRNIIPESEFSMFTTGTATESSPQIIMSGDNTPRNETNSVNIGFILSIPNSPSFALTNNTYSTTVNFTLTIS